REGQRLARTCIPESDALGRALRPVGDDIAQAAVPGGPGVYIGQRVRRRELGSDVRNQAQEQVAPSDDREADPERPPGPSAIDGPEGGEQERSHGQREETTRPELRG